MDTNHNSKIAKNTFFLYFRMFATMGMYFYTSRIVLSTLGISDFGIYNVVGGVVIMFSFLNSSMASATQKFLVAEIGNLDNTNLKNIFSMSINIHSLLALFIFFIAESLGLWFLNYKLKIPLDRIVAANWVYQFSILSFMITIMSIPYNALIIAHEKMQVYAIVSIIDVLLKFMSVLFLVYIGNDKLIVYSILVFIVSLIVFTIYKFYSNQVYPESHYFFFWDYSLFKTMINFAGWNLFGNLAGITMMQGVNILLNIFFGPTINAARGIALQVSGAVNGFVSNFQIAINPQIHKSFASSNLEYMHLLIYSGAKYSFFMLYIIVLPVLFETEFVLNFWLTVVPKYTVIFCQLLIIVSLVDCLSGTLITAAQSTGKIKLYQAVVGGILLLNLPFCYILLLMGYPPYFTLYISLGLSFVSLFARLMIVSKLIDLKIELYFKNVIFKILLVMAPSLLILKVIISFLEDDDYRILWVIFNSIIIVVTFIYLVGTNKLERDFIKLQFEKIINKKK